MLAGLHPAPKVGVEMIEVARVRRMLTRTPSAETLLFTERERASAHGAVDPVPRFTRLIAAKEAVLKALGLSSLTDWALRVEVLGEETAEPRAYVDGWPDAVNIHLSISSTGSVVVAVAVLVE